jgi:hypothetical protein
MHPGFYERNTQRIKSKIDATLSDEYGFFGRESKLDKILIDNFGIRDLNLISKEDRKKIYIVFSHMMKRSINGLRQSRSMIDSNVDFSDKEFLQNIREDIMIHDAIHSMVRYMKDPSNQTRDPQRFLPTPFKNKNNPNSIDRESLEEELFVLIWKPGQIIDSINAYSRLQGGERKDGFPAYFIKN